MITYHDQLRKDLIKKYNLVVTRSIEIRDLEVLQKMWGDLIGYVEFIHDQAVMESKVKRIPVPKVFTDYMKWSLDRGEMLGVITRGEKKED